MPLGKSIRIYLKDGTATGIRVCELINHTIQSIAAPRIKTNELSEFKESNRPGIYFLFGKDEESNEDLAYIGEAENVFDRLQFHLLNKEFWNEVVLFVSKDENLTKAHVKYLESRLIQMAFAAKRYKIENYNQPQLSSLPLADRDAMEEFLLQIQMLIGLNGHKLLEQYLERPASSILIDNPSRSLPEGVERELSLSIANVCAKAVQSNEGLVVLAGSEATNNPAPGLSAGYTALRQRLINNGSLIFDAERFKFAKDTLFASPSAAAAIIVGYNISGPQAWKGKDGRSLKMIEEDKIMKAADIQIAAVPAL